MKMNPRGSIIVANDVSRRGRANNIKITQITVKKKRFLFAFQKIFLKL